jgi:glutamyl-tRNA reductase
MNSHSPRATLPIALVSLDFRDAPSRVRHAYLAADAEDGPGAELLSSKAAQGLVRLQTCSRVGWLVSSNQARWAASLLVSGLAVRTRLGPQPTVHTGAAALEMLLRTAAGLESVVEGEAAVHRQLLQSFSRAHQAGQSDRVITTVWRHLEHLLHARRTGGLLRDGAGVQALVADTLTAQLPPGATVHVLGLGDIGRAVVRVVQARGFVVVTHPRKQLEPFLQAARRGEAVVVCTGAPNAWLALPPAPEKGPRIAIDLGSPTQISQHAGWSLHTIDDLLLQQRHALPQAEQQALGSLVRDELSRLERALTAPPAARALEALDTARHRFQQETLPALLEGLQGDKARAIKAAFSSFAHEVMETARRDLPATPLHQEIPESVLE